MNNKPKYGLQYYPAIDKWGYNVEDSPTSGRLIVIPFEIMAEAVEKYLLEKGEIELWQSRILKQKE